MSFHDRTWIWNPEWKEEASETTAGGFVHFRKQFDIDVVPASEFVILITADTRYKLYVNSQFVHYGPVKGDSQLWYYDELDIQPYLRIGVNHVAVHVLRLYYNTRFGTSFPRLPLGGLRIQHVCYASDLGFSVNSDETWETAIDVSATLLALKEDMFLHTYEAVDRRNDSKLNWVPAKQHKIFTAFGLTPQWHLSPRLIPFARLQPAKFQELHNIKSQLDRRTWEAALLGDSTITFPAGTIHHVEIETSSHLTAFLSLRFLRPRSPGSKLTVTYSECYEDPPAGTNRRLKADRRDTSKQIMGPYDTFIFAGQRSMSGEKFHNEENSLQVFEPYHFRTFRFLALDIEVASESNLTLVGRKIVRTNYPLDVYASIKATSEVNPSFPIKELWDTSVRTLENCMHDCYEDCPFYEQLQYAMDTRSSILFTYYISGDDRLARQAIRQLANSFQPGIGLTASRAPCHHLQIIPHFSLFWILIVVDHFEHYGDTVFISEFLPICYAVLESFKRRIDPEVGLVRVYPKEEFWDFVDWTQKWKPFGVPPAGRRTGFQTFSSSLYAYTLQRLLSVLRLTGKNALVTEYEAQSQDVVKAIRLHCYDGQFFTDGLHKLVDPKADYSIHNQVWAILSGAINGKDAATLLDLSLTRRDLTIPSIAMSFYTLRALSLVGEHLYESHFFKFWTPWAEQLSQNVTTWVEDPVSQRSDCHAWGSAPIYEFLAEVVGIKPHEPGWKSISFRPRIGLFRSLQAKVPIVLKDISEVVIADVAWIKKDSGKVDLSLELKTKSGNSIDVPVVVSLSNAKKGSVGTPLILSNLDFQNSDEYPGFTL